MIANPAASAVSPEFCGHPWGCTCWYSTPLHPDPHCNASSAGVGVCAWAQEELENISRGLGVPWRKDAARAAKGRAA